eukprot:Seg2243.5 transcript_id=Seg2243.5/GoldUCD/mRNA.D3Y31 product=Titin protein_id=Seg2243.5/GoldUCD/D3Y31
MEIHAPLPTYKSFYLISAFVVFALLARNTSFASKENRKLDAKPMYIGLPSKSLDIKWMYIAENMYKEVKISYLANPPDSANKIIFWKIHYFPSNKSRSSFKRNVVNNTFNNLTELTTEIVSMQPGRVREIFHLRIKSIPRNISSFGFECRVSYNVVWIVPSTKIITIKVAVPPVVKMIVHKGEGDHVPKGSPIYIRCSASGFPQPSLEMKKGSATLSSTRKLKDNEIILTLPKVQPTDAGLYVCVASNIADVARSFSSITVRYIELKETKDTVIQSVIGSRKDLNCPIRGYPQILYSWFKGTKKLGSLQELTVKLEKNDQFGNYTCKGMNDAGTRNITFSIIHNPSTSQRNANGIGSSSITKPYFAAYIILLILCGSLLC